jgi:hypothetical protein
MGFPCLFAFSQLRYVALAKYDGDDNEGKGKKKPCQEEGRERIYTHVYTAKTGKCVCARVELRIGGVHVSYILFLLDQIRASWSAGVSAGI